MRIAYFTDTYAPEINGVSRTLQRLVFYLEKTGHEVMVFAPAYKGEPNSANVVRFPGITPHLFSPNSCLAVPSYVLVSKKIQEFQPDLIHVLTEFGIGHAGVRAAKDFGIPLVTSYHTNYDIYLKHYHLSYLELPVKLYLKNFHTQALLNLCPSMDTLEQLRQQGYTHLDIWSRGIDAHRFSPAFRSVAFRTEQGVGEKFVFLYVGRISVEKGLDQLIKAIPAIYAQSGGRAAFWFVGDGPFLEKLQEADLPGTTLFGFQSGVALSRIYASADAFVFPSATETFGNVLLEAMASGLPVICTDRGGIRDYTRHMENALVYPYENVTELTGCMYQMMEDDVLRQRLVQNGLNTAAGRSWEQIWQRLMTSYQKAMMSAAALQLA